MKLEIPQCKIIFYDSEKKEKVPFSTLEPSLVKMYTCGPTIYNFAHIGNLRTFVFEDILRKTLKFFGFRIKHVMNITDIDDKTIKGAIANNMTLKEFTTPFKEAFFEDLKNLHVESAEYYPLATEYIPEMILFIQDLLDKKVAYKGKDGSIYYALAQCPHYGRLSHLKLNDLKVGAGDEANLRDEYDKENAADFVLWKTYDPERDGKIYWESPYGRGRPGWHLECSTMAMSLLGESLDIHCGAVDNIFPHHENEIAQSESRSGKKFVQFWLHAEHLLVNHKKMSKSLGNFYNLRDLMNKGYKGHEIRFALMQAHYRTQLNFTMEGIEGARNALFRLNDFVKRLQLHEKKSQEMSTQVQDLVLTALHKFSEAMADDLNISVALATIFDLMHEGNKLSFEGENAKCVLEFLKQANKILSIMSFEEEEIPQEIDDLLAKRQEARSQKLWKEADHYRDEIIKRGYYIDDTSQGPRIKKKQ